MRQLSLKDYQSMAMSTAIYPNKGKGNIIYPTLGLVGEAGEVANVVKKIDRDDGGVLTPQRKEQLLLELSDVLWYAAALATELDVSLEYVAERNINKLMQRKQANNLKGHNRDA